LDTDDAYPLIQVGVSALNGSTRDPEGKEGLTRLLTRLMRRTANGLSADQVDEQVDSIGASLGADVSASTTGFAGSVIARSFSKFGELLGGVLNRPGLAEDELERLKRETVADLQEMLDNDRSIARRWFRRALFDGHPYGRSSTGSQASLSNISIDDVREHYQACFHRGALQYAFAGDVTEPMALALVEQLETALPPCPPGKQALGEADAFSDPEGPKGRKLWVVDKPERTQTQILIGGLGTHPADEDHTALLVANTVFGGTFTARLTQEVRSKRGWSYGAYSSMPFDRRRQSFSMWTFPKASDAAACVALQLALLETWVADGITQAELEYAQSYLVKSNVFSIDTAAKRMAQALDERIYQLPKDYFSTYTDRVSAVTLQQANEAIAKRISTRDLALVVVGTEAEVGQPLRDAVPDLAEYRVIPFDTD
jgi:zinc protease